VDTAVASLVSFGTVLHVPKAPFLFSPLGVVPKAENKLRLILDLRYLNQLLELTKFKYETIKSVPDLCAPGDFLFMVDLKSGYHPNRYVLGALAISRFSVARSVLRLHLVALRFSTGMLCLYKGYAPAR
jgi:hypothetical protein